MMDQLTLPTTKEWRRHARTYCHALSTSTAHRRGPLHSGVTPGRAPTLGASAGGGGREAVSPGCGPTRWPGTAGDRPAWVASRARRPNRHWRRACDGAACPCSAWSGSPLACGAAAALYPPLHKSGGPAALARPAGRFHRRCRCGPPGAAGTRCPGRLTGPAAPAPARVARGTGAGATARPHGPTLCLLLGRRRVRGDPAGGSAPWYPRQAGR